jgi:hypothetical protein
LELDEVQHGIAAVKDPSIVRFLADHKIRLNITPSSNYLLALFLCIAYRGICSSAFMLYTTYHKICSVNHAPIADLDSGFWVCFGRSSTHLDFIIIVKVLLFVVTVLCFHVWQDEREMGIATSVPVAALSLNEKLRYV